MNNRKLATTIAWVGGIIVTLAIVGIFVAMFVDVLRIRRDFRPVEIVSEKFSINHGRYKYWQLIVPPDEKLFTVRVKVTGGKAVNTRMLDFGEFKKLEAYWKDPFQFFRSLSYKHYPKFASEATREFSASGFIEKGTTYIFVIWPSDQGNGIASDVDIKIFKQKKRINKW